MSHDDRCQWCQADLDASEPSHGPNCPAYRGPARQSPWAGERRLDDLERRVAELEAQRVVDVPRLEFEGETLHRYAGLLNIRVMRVDGEVHVFLNGLRVRPGPYKHESKPR